MQLARIILDPPATGSWNMAVDQALLESTNLTGQVTIRFYAWEEPTLSLGYFQNSIERMGHQASLGCPLVRRSTGGGAILHDQEITYSLCLPCAQRWSIATEDLYWIVHRSLCSLLNDQKIDAKLFSDETAQPPRKESAPKSFLCFQRRSPGDLILDGHKIAGSAQRRKKGALLQHGSLLLIRSTCAVELPGINDLVSNGPLHRQNFLADWLAKLVVGLDLEPVVGELTSEERRAAQENEATFLSATWNQKR